MEYLIGAGTTIIFLWALWVSYSIYQLSTSSTETTDVLENHKDAIMAVAEAVAESDLDESTKTPMGFMK